MLGCLISLLRGEPLTLGHYRTSEMQRWVQEITDQHRIDIILVFSSSMAQYVKLTPTDKQVRRVIDFVDVDSDKWRQYAERKTGWMKWIYRREWKKLLAYERKVASAFDLSLFVSDDEANLFKSLAPAHSGKIHGIGNGVDLSFFSAARVEKEVTASPYPDNSRVIVFTGAMDYWANIDAVNWFVSHVWRRVRAQVPHAQFYIVGSNPTADVYELEREPGVVVTGRVEDIRPYIHFSELAVAPMQVARGVQNKILEAMALNKPVISTSLGFEGLAIESAHSSENLTCLVADDPETFAHKVIGLLKPSHPIVSEWNRNWVERHFSWESQLEPLSSLLQV
jgi:sugar transferase (PEP-CTERM/EpsH1 system associated)